MTSTFLDLMAEPGLLRGVLLRLGLIGRDEPMTVEQLAGGVSSTILKVEMASRRVCIKQALPVLKVAKVWSAPVERVYAEIDWLQLVAQIAPGCVPEVLGVDRSTNSFVMSFLEPHLHPNWKSEMMAGRVDVWFAGLVGAKLARIHAETANRTDVRRKFSNDNNFFQLRLDPYFLEAAKRYPLVAMRLRELVDRTLCQKRALVHGDMSPKNMLVGSEDPIFLDAECACYGDPAFDLAFCLNHLLLKSVAIPHLSGSLLDAYTGLAEAYLSGVNWELGADIESRTASLLPGLILARISGKSPVEYLDESARAAIVKATVPLITAPPTRLETLKHAWKDGLGL